MAIEFDLSSLPDAFFDDPYPTYRALREHDPVHLSADGSYFLTRYADLKEIYRDPGCSSDKRALFGPKFGPSPLYEHHTTSLVFNDPPYHTRVRALIAAALDPATVRAMQPELETLVDALLDDLEQRGRIDLVEDYAARIPVEVIGNLLRVPHDQRGPLRGWSTAILGALEVDLSARQMAAGNQAVEEFLAFLKDLVDARRRRPLDPNTDLLTHLIQGEGENRLSEKELLHNLIFLLNAGHETTGSMIGNAVHALLVNPDQLRRLRRDPGLIRGAVEETLRFEPPVQIGNRQTTAPVELPPVTLPAGAQVFLCIAAANRDPAQFPDPDRFDIGRRANAHLAFAAYRHACLGNLLGRLEGAIAIGRLVRRFGRMEFAGTPVRERRARFRRFQSLPLTVA